VKFGERVKLFFQGVPKRGWWGTIREAFAGAWQRNIEWNVDDVLQFHPVFACVTRIAQDVGKLRFRLVQLQPSGVWKEVRSSAFSPVLRDPNRYQNQIQFRESWMLAKLIHGNSYILKERDDRQVVRRLYVLDPLRTQPLVANDGSVWYQLAADNLSGVEASVMVPASEIIHDRWNTLYHPLVGVSPLYAAGLPASLALRIQEDSARFFGNGARPGGILTAPGAISDETAKRLKDHWEANYTGASAGKVAVLGDGLKFEGLRMSSVESELIKQLEWDAQAACTAYHVPPFKIGIGTLPAGQKVGDINQVYYSDCLQYHLESMEVCLDEGLGLGGETETTMGVEIDTEGLLRMDPLTKADVHTKLTGGGIEAIDEARMAFNLGPVDGGNTPYLQQQNYSLSALAERDRNSPLVGALPAPPAPAPTPDPAGNVAEEAAAAEARDFLDYIQRKLTHAA
jgi:HK97 family phage portal protein